VRLGRAAATTREVLETILQWSEDDPDFDGAGQTADEDLPRRLRELAELLEQTATGETLHQAAQVLWEEIGEDWEAWLRARFKSTLGAALIEAAHSLCPRMGGGTLVLDLQPRPDRNKQGNAAVSGKADEIWLTESTIGGGGFVEDFLRRYVEDPRRYFRLLEASLAPSDLELVSEELTRVLRFVASAEPASQSLGTAFAAVRDAASHADSVRALNTLRTELTRHGVQPTPTLLISLGVRVLRPGTNADIDRFLARAMQEWEDAEERLGIDIDARVFALVKSSDPTLEQALPVDQRVAVDSATTSWRYGVLYGMFWSRGAQIRSESLRAWNPFHRLPDCDRLLTLAAAPRSTRQVMLSSPNWFEELAALLVQHGAVELVGGLEESERMAKALLRIGTQPIDSEALLIHARITGIHRDGGRIMAEIELPEAFQ